MGKANAAADKVFLITDSKSEIDPLGPEEENKLRIPLDESFKGEIEFRNVWFRYPARKSDWILKGLNMKIKRNETVALVGESGCGKSTIVSLILRFYNANKGTILLDGIDIKDYKVSDLRRAMGFVMQEPILFNYTICENILYGKIDATNQ
jgi:ATP-binding cassette, subfamily B (MDR/TAP), member 1